MVFFRFGKLCVKQDLYLYDLSVLIRLSKTPGVGSYRVC